MSRGARIGIAVGALVAAIVLFIVLKPSDESDTGGGGKAETTAPAETGTAPAEDPKPKPAPKPEPERVVIAGGQPKGGVQEIEVGKGETVRLVVSSADTGGEVHIHGYDLFKHLEAGGQVRFVFKASIEGVFEVELEETATPLAELRVSP